MTLVVCLGRVVALKLPTTKYLELEKRCKITKLCALDVAQTIFSRKNHHQLIISTFMARRFVVFFGLFYLCVAHPHGRAQADTVAAKKSLIPELKLPDGVPFDASGGMNASATLPGMGTKSAKDALDFITNDLPDLGLKFKEKIKKEKARMKKNRLARTEYEGVSMQKMAIVVGSAVIEFHVLKKYAEPNPYAPEVFWYDPAGRQISKSVIKDPAKVLLLHGPYKRYRDDLLEEEGFYAVGAKDGRWEKYNPKNGHLIEKSYWEQGFPADSRFVYYDSAHAKIKEVYPVQFGKKKGTFYGFYEGGQLMERGNFDNEQKIGTWIEYHAVKQRQKKVTQHRPHWYDDVETHVEKEWDEKGKLIYERPKPKSVN